MPLASQQIRFCSSDGYRIAYAVAGRGPYLVKAAHYLTNVEHDWDNPAAGPWLHRLARSHTLIRYDERGMGLSDREVPEISLDAWVRDLESVVDVAGLERFPLLGLSQGAAIAIAYAAKHPERVSHLILYGSFARGRLMRDPTPEQIVEAEAMVKLAEVGWGRDNPAFRQMFTSQILPNATPEQHHAFNELQRLSATPEMAARIMRLFDRLEVSDLARSIACPTLVMHTRQDARIPFEEGRRVAALIPGARFVPLTGTNHLLTEGNPALTAFLEELSGFLAAGGVRPAPTASHWLLTQLTPREREILHRIARGLANAEIANDLDVSEKTVRNHITRLFDKLQVNTRAQAIVLARDAGIG